MAGKPGIVFRFVDSVPFSERHNDPPFQVVGNERTIKRQMRKMNFLKPVYKIYTWWKYRPKGQPISVLKKIAAYQPEMPEKPSIRYKSIAQDF